MKRVRCSSTEYFVRQGLGSSIPYMHTAQTETVRRQYKNAKHSLFTQPER